MTIIIHELICNFNFISVSEFVQLIQLTMYSIENKLR